MAQPEIVASLGSLPSVIVRTNNSNLDGYRLSITDTTLSDVQSHLLPGVPPPGSQIRSKSCGSFFSDQISLILLLQNPHTPPVQQNESTNVFSSDEISLGFYLEQQWGQQNKMSKADWPEGTTKAYAGCSRIIATKQPL